MSSALPIINIYSIQYPEGTHTLRLIAGYYFQEPILQPNPQIDTIRESTGYVNNIKVNNNLQFGDEISVENRRNNIKKYTCVIFEDNMDFVPDPNHELTLAEIMHEIHNIQNRAPLNTTTVDNDFLISVLNGFRINQITLAELENSG